MGPGRPFVLTESAFRELKREIHASRQEISNLRRHLAHASVRRHEGGWVPSLKRQVAQFSVGSASVTSTAVTHHSFSTFTDIGTAGAWSLDSGKGICEEESYFEFFLATAFIIPVVQNAGVRLTYTVQQSSNGGSSWGTLFSVIHTTFAENTTITTTEDRHSFSAIHSSRAFQPDHQIRMASEATTYGSYGALSITIPSTTLTICRSS